MQSGYGNHTCAIQVKFDFSKQNGLTQHTALGGKNLEHVCNQGSEGLAHG